MTVSKHWVGVHGTKIQTVQWEDGDGNPVGGSADFYHGNEDSHGWPFVESFRFQEGVISKGVNGLMIEDLIQVLIDRLNYFQKSQFSSDFNAEAVQHLGRAYDSLMKRRYDRERRGVLGKHEA